VDLKRPPVALGAEEVGRLPSSCGVYLLLGDDGDVLKIAYAGGRERFGLRSALQRELDDRGAGAGGEAATAFQCEVTMQYWGRWRELLIRHVREDGRLPVGNSPRDLDGVLAGVDFDQR
jgi:hypothetical protein